MENNKFPKAFVLFSSIVWMFKKMCKQLRDSMMGLIMNSSPFGCIYIIECTSHDVIKKCKFKTTLIGFCII
jgi:hypothetical protein